MAIRLPLICLLVSVTAITADLSPERYWYTALPNTPMPDSLRHLLTADFTGEKSTNVQVGKGGVIVHTRHKGKPVYVGVKPGPNPLYRYGPSKTQLHNDPKVTFFFLEKDMVPGKEMNLMFNAEDGYNGKSAFLPRGEAETVPFGSEKFSEILKTFSVKPGSGEADMMKETIEECEAKRVGEVEKYCATSLESMVDFSVSKLGKNHVRAVSSEVAEKNAPMQKYRIAAAGVKKLSDDKSVVCHKQKYPIAMFYCHKVMMTSVYAVPLEGENGLRAKAVAVCHKNTSAWNPNHMAFKVLKVKPGTVPVCHFLPETHVVWFSY